METDWALEYSEKHGVPIEHPFGVRCDPEKWLGAWGGWISANDWQGNARASIAPCCHPNAAMQFYRVWRDMIDYDEKKDRLSVHLLLNRASRWADVNSHLPYRGLVDVQLKTDCEVALRIPNWAARNSCECRLNGAAVDGRWAGRYVAIRAGAGDVVSVRLPLTERTERLGIVGDEYTVAVRGNEIVDIDPPGQRCPIFRKPKYRGGETLWRTVERYAPDGLVEEY